MVLGYAVVAAGTFVYVISTTRGESWAGFVVTLLGGLCIAALSSIAILSRFEEEDRAVSALLVSATSAVLIIPLLLIAAVFVTLFELPARAERAATCAAHGGTVRGVRSSIAVPPFERPILLGVRAE